MSIRISTSNRFQPSKDGWFHLATPGDHPHAEGLQKVTPASLQAIVDDYVNRGSPSLPIDIDHFSHDLKNNTAASGWINALACRDSGLWCRVKWTPIGENAITNGIYRFFSPVWQCDKATDGTLTPARLTDAALTNQPNIKNLTPISNRQPSPTNNNNQPTKTNMNNIAKALGLAETATEQEILAKIAELQASADEVETLQTENRALAADLVEHDLKAHEAVIDPAKREDVKAMLIANRAGTLAVLGSLKTKETPKIITNRTTATPPTPTKDDEAIKNRAAAARAAKIGNRAKQIQKTEGVSYATAFNRASSEFPAE